LDKINAREESHLKKTVKQSDIDLLKKMTQKKK
jgi:hypothetical protein